MKLVPNWQRAWKWFSVQAIGVALIWESIPDDVKDTVLTDDNQGRVTFGLLIAAGLGRMIRQPKANP